jgi:hypothetical protein
LYNLGVLNANEAIEIKAMYVAKEILGEEWQNANLVIEKNEVNYC